MCALQARKQLGGGEFYSIQGGQFTRDANGRLGVEPARYVETSSGPYKGWVMNNHTVLIKDGRVYDKMGGIWGMPYKEWAGKVGVGRNLGGHTNMIRRIPMSKVRAGIPRR